MKLLVGLGNPGSRYAGTRHNVGFRVVESWAAHSGIALDEERFLGRFGRGRFEPGSVGGFDVAVLEPLTYMNRSGAALAEALSGLSLEDPTSELLVVFDDVDLPFGRLRLRPSGSAGGHRGLGDVIERLGRSDFPRLRFGVGRPETDQDTRDWVLEPFTRAEEGALPGRLRAAVEAINDAFAAGVSDAMNRVNRAPSPEA